MKKVVYILFTIVSLSVNGQQVTDKLNDLSTPKGAWQHLLYSLKLGNSDSVKAVVTVNGFKSLIKYISPSSNSPNPFVATFQVWGNMWSNLELEWGEIKENKVNLKAESEDKSFLFTFLRIDTEWKMEYWNNELE